MVRNRVSKGLRKQHDEKTFKDAFKEIDEGL